MDVVYVIGLLFNLKKAVFHFLILMCMMGVATLIYSQNGSPIVRNITKMDYSGGTQNYEIIQDEFGFVYSANNDGLLMYDGAKWRCFPLPNRTNLRSLELVDEGILVGGQNEFGLFRKAPNGLLVFENLRNLFPADVSLEDIWDISTAQDRVFIRTRKSIWTYKNGVIELLDGDGTFDASFVFDQTYYYQNANELVSYPDAQVIATFAKSDRCIAPIEYNDQVIYALENNGLVSKDGAELDGVLKDLSRFLGESGLNCITSFEDGFLLGTKNAGLITVNRELEIEDVYNIQTGLQRNEVFDAHVDENSNFWLATSNGIDQVLQSSPYRYLSPDGELHGAGYGYCNYKDQDYYATSYGVYVWIKEGVSGSYRLLQGTKGIAWSVGVVNDLLWIGHEKGCFYYDGSQVKEVKGLPGTWIYFDIENDNDHVLVGHYEGVSVLEKANQNWVLKGAAFGLEESCRIGAYEGDDVWWISHPYRGAWRMKLNRKRWDLDEVQFVGEEKGFLSTLHICASQLQNQVVFTAEKGLFIYDQSKDSVFSMDSWLSGYNLNRRFLRVFEESEGDVWCILEDAVEVLRVEETPVSKEWTVQKVDGIQSQFLAGFESLVDDGAGHLVAGSDDGFIKIDKSRLEAQNNNHPNLMVLEVELMNHNDSVLYHPFSGLSQIQNVNVPLGRNSIRINYSTTSHKLADGLRYQTYLEGLDEDWVGNGQQQFKEFTNLEPGEYVFKLRVLNSSNELQATTELKLTVDSPWYLTTWALVFWFFLGGLALLMLVLLPQNRFERQKEEIIKEKEVEISIQREETTELIDKMKHDQLNTELQFKNKELASVTMHLVQKGQILQDIRSSLKKVDLKNHNSSEREIARIIKIIKDDVRLDNNWNKFERHFDQVHVDFLKRLKLAHQNLSPNDHKLCAYLKMNLSTKEIATIMNISVRGVEISRYRLRKKLGMEKDENLPEYIQSI